MPEIRHYTITAEVSFDLSAPVPYHEAVKVVEERLSAALKTDRGLNQLENGRIVTVTAVRDTRGAARPAGGKVREIAPGAEET